MICPYCNKENPDDTFFCSECGKILEDFSPKPEPEPEPEETDSSFTSFVDEKNAATSAPAEPVESAPSEPVAEPAPIEPVPAAIAPIEPAAETVPSEPVPAPAAIIPITGITNTAPASPVSVSEPAATESGKAAQLPVVPSEPEVKTVPAVSEKALVPVKAEPLPKKKKKIPLPAIIGGAAGVVVLIVVIVIIATAPARKYRKAMKALDNGDYEEAATQFKEMGDYKDAFDKVNEAIAESHYSKGQKAFDDGDYETAKTEFTAAGSYKDASDKARESERAGYYAYGCSLITSGQYDSAIAEFNKCDGYKDSVTQIKKCYYLLGENALAHDSLDEATEYFKLADDYQNGSGKASEISYDRGEKAYNDGNLSEAAKFFALAGNHRDAEQRSKELYYKLGTEANNKKDYDNAANYLKLAGDYLDASDKTKVAAYNSAVIYLKAKDYEKAGYYLALAGDYRNSQNALIKQIQALVKAKDYDNARKMIVSYSGEDAGSWSNYIDGMIAFNNKDFISAANSFKAAGEFLNSVVCYKSSNYNHGLVLLKNKQFSEARPYFVAGGNYSVSKDLVHLCDAEIYYASGKIAQASKEYAKINKKTKISQFNIWSRKTHVDTRVTLERAKGNYSADSNRIYVKRTETNGGYSDERYSSNVWDGQYINLSFTMNSNGTFDITIELAYGRYRNYAYYSSDAKNEIYTITKKYKKQKKMPTTFKIDNNTTLKYSKNTFTLVYTKNVDNGSYIDQFSSTVVYKKVED